jgi:cytochrome c-type biogenesis protein CcmF
MLELGHFSLVLAWLLSLYAIVIGIFAGYKKQPLAFISQKNASLICFVATFFATFALGYGFVTNDYSNQYIWQFSNRDMPTIYKITAIWGGMDGSMLLWCMMVSLSVALLSLTTKKVPFALAPWVLSFANSSTFFFLTVTTFLTNPFRYLAHSIIPADGNGLNPLLQNPFMAIHPPTLYVGFTTLAIPYAFCMGALACGLVTNEWLRLTRRWTLIAWAFLTAGIVLGGFWAYIELGWGGFWAWDPVENASFLPWLTATAFLHSVMIQERKNMLRFWNVWLIVISYTLTVFGTFLTRSGVVQSVHAFASTDVGWVFLFYISLVLGVAGILSFLRRKQLRSERGIISYFSRETAFLLNNLLFLGIMFAVMWGTLFPVFSEWLGDKKSIAAPFYNAVTLPLFLSLIFLMAIGPMIAWQRASLSSIKKTFLKPFLISLLLTLILVWSGIESSYAIAAYSLSFFVVLTLIGELHRAFSIQRASASGSLPEQASQIVKKHRVKYGGYLVHFGVAVVTVAITASMAHKIEKDLVLKPGLATQIGRFKLTLESLSEYETKNYSALVSKVRVEKKSSSQLLNTLTPEMRRYFRNNESTSEVAINVSLKDDLYLVLMGIDDVGDGAVIKVYINPLQMWLWVGAILMVIGTTIALLPNRPLKTVVT